MIYSYTYPHNSGVSIIYALYIPVITTTKELYENLYCRIVPMVHTPGACRAIVLRVIEHFYRYDAVAIALDEKLSTNLSTNVLEDVITRLHDQEPIQYILQESYFANRVFKVTPAVLIPRSETEELTLRILQENQRPNLHVLDIATGSGCIAITLQKELNSSFVDALDISGQALQIARHNAAHHQAIIHWHQLNILKDSLPKKKWDIIVSNPPYVCISEVAFMLPQVIAYEPAQALFVPDESPLMFYDRIIQQARKHLTPSGRLYLEINERFGKDVSELCHTHNFREVSLAQDLNNKDRFVIGAY